MDWKNRLAYWRGIVGPALGSHKINLRPVRGRLPSLLADCHARAGIAPWLRPKLPRQFDHRTQNAADVGRFCQRRTSRQLSLAFRGRASRIVSGNRIFGTL
jgi:hypothetical protein